MAKFTQNKVKKVKPGDSVFELKKCPKCGRLMVDESIRVQGNKWKTRWHCLCGHVEEEME